MLPVLLLLWAGCGGTAPAGDTVAESQAPELQPRERQAQEMVEQQMEAIQEEEAATFPCNLFGQEEIEALLGNGLASGAYTFEHQSDGEHEWQAAACSWDGLENGAAGASLWVSRAQDFADGQVQCFAGVGSASNALADVGGVRTASWDFDRDYGIGVLRVCSDHALLEAQVIHRGEEEPAMLQKAKAMAEKAVAGS